MKGRFLILGFVLSALGYSLVQELHYSVWIKPLPVLFCFLILLWNQSWSPPTAKIVLVGLVISMVGDIALDLSATTLGIGIFTLVMSLYGVALYKANKDLSTSTLIPTLLVFGGIYAMMYPHLADRKVSAAIYQLVLIWMVWQGATMLIWSTKNNSPTTSQKWLLFLGVLGIAMNGVLYGVDLYLLPIPRDLVIHSYYFGQLLLVLGLIKR
jgi:hypothetical protein